MATHNDIREIAARLPGSVEGEGRFGFSVPVKGKYKGYVWSWMERVTPKKPKVESQEVVAIVTRNLQERDMLIESDSEKYFTEDHYNGFSAVLVRVAAVDVDELEDLLIEAWKVKASKELIAEYESAQS